MKQGQQYIYVYNQQQNVLERWPPPESGETELCCDKNDIICHEICLEAWRPRQRLEIGKDFEIKDYFIKGNYSNVCLACGTQFFHTDKYWRTCQKCSLVAVPLNSSPEVIKSHQCMVEISVLIFTLISNKKEASALAEKLRNQYHFIPKTNTK